MTAKKTTVKRKAANRAPRVPGLTFHPATADRWDDVQALFGERGACGGCWCMAWRLPKKEWLAGKADHAVSNRRGLKTLVESDTPPGVLAYVGDEPVGWCAIAPRQAYVALQRSRVLQPVDDKPVWSISCLFITRAWRRRGISAKLIDAAAKFAISRGARIVEGYPVEPYSDKIPDAFAWTGIPASFERAKFKEVARRSKTRPIMRRAIR